MIIVRLVGGAEGYFLPGIITGSLTIVMCFVREFALRPLV